MAKLVVPVVEGGTVRLNASSGAKNLGNKDNVQAFKVGIRDF